MRTVISWIPIFLVACGGATPPANGPSSETATNAASEASESTNANGTSTAPPSEAADPSETTSTPPSTASANGGGGNDTASAPPPPTRELPKECANKDGDVCSMPPDFVERLCSHHHPDIALTLFAKGSPWTRMYLRGNVDAWYTGAGSSPRAKIAFDEEVLVLRFRAPPKGGIIIGDGGGQYDVLRWDGYCYSLEGNEVTKKRPPKAKMAQVAFHKFGSSMQHGLLADPAIKAAYDKREKECKGVTSGEVSLACERADRALSTAIIEHVRAGRPLPPPDRIP